MARFSLSPAVSLHLAVLVRLLHATADADTATRAGAEKGLTDPKGCPISSVEACRTRLVSPKLCLHRTQLHQSAERDSRRRLRGIADEGDNDIFMRAAVELTLNQSSHCFYIDVGANTGQESPFAARMGCEVLAFEPGGVNSRTLQRKMQSICLTRPFTFCRAVVSTTDLPRVPFVESGFVGYAPPVGRRLANAASPSSACTCRQTIATQLDEAEASRRKSGNQTVASMSLDAAVQSKHAGCVPEEISFLKVDTEGHEVLAMRGATSLVRMRRVQYMLLEWAPSRWDRAGVTLSEGSSMLHEIMAAGYNVYISRFSHFYRACPMPEPLLHAKGFSVEQRPITGLPGLGSRVLVRRTEIEAFHEFLATTGCSSYLWVVRRPMKH
jgi:FkbM family methyltransferase